jgi:hypothetical protein
VLLFGDYPTRHGSNTCERMNRPVALSALFMAGCLAGGIAKDVIAPARAQGQVGPSYEYDVVSVANDRSNDKEVLQKYGAAGWRLAAATQDGPWRTLYLERQLAAR